MSSFIRVNQGIEEMKTVSLKKNKEYRMGIDEVYSLIGDDLNAVEEYFKKELKSKVSLITKIGEYILLSGGKRLRPSLLILSARLCNYQGNRHIPLGSIIEFIHTATLLHDDVVDNARLRRGRPSANSVWGNGASVLVGDFLFSKSFYLMVEDSDMRILKLMSDTTTHIAEGEVLQLLKCSDINTTEEEYISVVINKTASLISAACEIGAILGKVSKEKEAALAEFGLNLGIAFQLMDDCFDYIARKEELGKDTGNDLKEGKVTLPLIHTLRECSNPNEKDIITKAIEGDSPSSDHLEEVICLVNKYGGVEYTMKQARDYVERAKAYLDFSEDNIYRSALLAIADYVVERKN